MIEFVYSVVAEEFETSGTMSAKNTREVLLAVAELIEYRNLKNVKIEIKENE